MKVLSSLVLILAAAWLSGCIWVGPPPPYRAYGPPPVWVAPPPLPHFWWGPGPGPHPGPWRP